MSGGIPALFDELEIGIALFDPATGEIDSVNSRLESLSGYTAAELRGMGYAEYSVGAEGFTQAEAERRIRAAADGETGTFDWLIERPTGERVWLSVRLGRTTIDGESFVAAEVRDITERKRREREHQAVLDRMSDAFFALDDAWEITHANRRAAEVLAEAMDGSVAPEPEAVEGRHLWESIPEAVETVFYHKFQEAVKSQEPVTFEEYYEPLGMWLDYRIYPSESGLSVYFYDVTERRRQREVLERREDVLREMHGIIADRSGEFTEQVEALLALGRSELDVRYGTLSKIDGEEYVFEIVDAADDSIAAGDVVPLSATNCETVASENRTLVLGDIARDAPEQTDRLGYTEMGICSYIGAPLEVDEEVYGTFCFYDTDTRDGEFTEWEVTLVELLSRWVNYELQRQSATEQLQRQNERLERFASTVSHDLRNPLNVLDGRLDLAAETGDDDHFAACRRAVDRMNTLIDELLSLARVGETIDDREAVALDSLVERAWTTVDTDAATLRIDTDRTVAADETRLCQLVENLLRNAIEHGGEGVTVTVGELDGGFYVEDDGEGIPADDRETVFESGYSTMDRGTGFGLAIVAEVAEAHGWTVTATESKGGGARFEFTGVGAA